MSESEGGNAATPDAAVSGAADGRGVAIELRNLTIRAGRRLLLDNAAARFEPGQITLVVGPSGAGKSLLLRTLAGLLDLAGPEVSATGTALIGERDVIAEGAGGNVGVVFQNAALFDELSPLDNVRFAAAHRQAGPQGAAGVDAEALLRELRVPLDVRASQLSGGQRQRLALARTLAFDPPVVLYDEPTSNLDAASARQVAELIRATHERHRKTSIVVTHDDRSLAPIADHVYLVDPATRSLIELPREEWGRLETHLHPPDAEGDVSNDRAGSTPAKKTENRGWLARAGRQVGDFFVGVANMAAQASLLPWRLVPRWKSWKWGLRLTAHYLRLVAGPSAWIYVALAGAITGFVATYFTFRFFPYRTLTEPLVIEDLLHALGFVIYRVVAPLLISVLVAARCGAAVASDVGGKTYGRQVDALRTFNAPPTAYLMTNIAYAFLLGILVLGALGFVAARLASLLVFSSTHPQFGPFYWDSHFFAELRVPGDWWFRGTGWLVAKLLVSAAGIAVIAYERGRRPKHSTTDVSDGITATVLWATLYVLAVHMAFAFFEFEDLLPP